MTDTTPKEVTETMTVDRDARWIEIQDMAYRIAFGDAPPTPLESALCGAVTRAKDAINALSEETRRNSLLGNEVARLEHDLACMREDMKEMQRDHREALVEAAADARAREREDRL